MKVAIENADEKLLEEFEKYMGYSRKRFSHKDVKMFNVFQSGYNIANGEKMIQTKYNLKLLVDIDENFKAGDYLNNWISDPSYFIEFKSKMIESLMANKKLNPFSGRSNREISKVLFKVERKEFIIE